MINWWLPSNERATSNSAKIKVEEFVGSTNVKEPTQDSESSMRVQKHAEELKI